MRSIVMCAAAAVLCVPFAAFPEEATGSVTGVVKDQSGAAVPRAQLLLANPTNRYVTLSDTQGGYSFKDLPAGQYALSVESFGFRKRLTHILVASSVVLSQDITLEIGNAGGCPVIEVRAWCPLPEGRVVSGVVVDRRGRRVSRAIVSVYTLNPIHRRSMTSVEGTFRFDDVWQGPALITAEYGKYAEGELNVPQAGCVTADLKIIVGDRSRLRDSQ